MANLITENSSFREVINAIIEEGTDSLPKILEIFWLRKFSSVKCDTPYPEDAKNINLN